jgi:Lsr2
MQLTVDSQEPLEKVLMALGSLYGVELAVAGGAAKRELSVSSADVRAWARANGHAVKGTGRVPAAVLAAYRSR